MIDPIDGLRDPRVDKYDPSICCVAVVVPCFNCEQYVSDAISSALAETDVGLVIVVDDGSTDGSVSVVEQHPGFGARLQLVQQTNQGQGAARNRGAMVAAGAKFLIFLDADDYLLPGAVQRLMKEAADGRYAAVGGRARYLSADGSKLMGRSSQVPIPLDEVAISAARLNPFAMGGVLISKASFVQVGGFSTHEAAGSGFPEDLDFWSRMTRVGGLRLIDQDVLAYRVRPGSVSATRAGQLLQGTRYLQERIACAQRGETFPPYDEWMRSAPKLVRADRGRVRYRQAGEFLINGHKGHAIRMIVMAFVLDPRYVTRRLLRQLL